MLQAYCLGVLLCIAGSYAMYDSSSVVDLTPSNFDQLVAKSDDVWLVEFYAPWCGHCQNLVPEYKKAAEALKGLVKVGAIDANTHKSLGSKYGVTGYPTIKIFKGGKDTPYSGARNAKAFAEAALAAVTDKVMERLGAKSSGSSGKSGDVVTLTDSNFDKMVLESEDLWLVEFYAPWCGHCKNLEPHWAKAATELKGKVKLGALDATVHQTTAALFEVQGYPTIKFFPAGKKSRSDAEEYNGGRTHSDIVAWATDKLADSVAAPEIHQLVNSESLVSCGAKPLCVVSLLPHILDCNAACRNQYLTVLTTLGDKYKKKMWGWVWAEAGSQPSLEAALELGGFGYPAMAVLNANKLKFSTLRGSFSEQGINEFLRELSFGRGRTSAVRGAALPTLDSIEPWDGQDGTLPPEEDIDLSDLDLDKDEL